MGSPFNPNFDDKAADLLRSMPPTLEDYAQAERQQRNQALAVNMAQGTLGSALGSLGRSTPGEDVVRAVQSLNQALAAAAYAGWTVELAVGEPNEAAPAYTGLELRSYQRLTATISKAI